jgi:outer membrane protein OmpA-like peptidoglycan-associated protein
MIQNKTMIGKVFIQFLILVGVATESHAQDTLRPQPKWWFGVTTAANFNFYSGTTQRMSAAVKAPTAFHNGNGLSPYAALRTEYRFNPKWGVILNLGYDARTGTFNAVSAPCNCPEELKSKISYVTVEPSLRFAPFSSKFYLFAGGGVSYNINKKFSYTQEQKPDTEFNTAEGDFSDMRKIMYSGHIGAGYEIPLSAITNPTQLSLSPFVSYHPYFGQSPRTVESWSMQTVRVGLALKIGTTPAKAVIATVVMPAPAANQAQFTVFAPPSVPVNRRVKENFPMRDYVFFDEGSTEIPKRYTLLNKEQAVNFKEGKFQEPEPNNLSGRSERQMIAYYNILNILGDRMRKNPMTTVTLTGSSAGKGAEIGKEEAESVKTYLVTVYGINGARITTEGRNMPINPSEHEGGTIDLDLLRAGDRRVEIVSNSPVLLAPLQLSAVQNDPLDGRVIFKAEDINKMPLKSWSLEIADDKGNLRYFGPFTSDKESISGNMLLDKRTEGDYNVVLLGETKDGILVKKESKLHLVRDATTQNEEAKRFSVLFDFDQSKTVKAYDKFLTDVVAPQVPDNGTVIIHGHSDVIGDVKYNKTLSQNRALDAQRILDAELVKLGKKGVKYEVYGFGADAIAAPFDNKFPEERFYNRTVVIDVIPR